MRLLRSRFERLRRLGFPSGREEAARFSWDGSGTWPVYPEPADQPMPKYMEPAAVQEFLRSRPIDPIVQLVSEETRSSPPGNVLLENFRLRTDCIQGRDIFMNCWFARPAEATGLVPFFYIPGGNGVVNPKDLEWAANTCRIAILGVDWLGCGESSELPGIGPWAWQDAIVFRGPDLRSSFQFHNVRALLLALDTLCARHEVAPERLMVGGTSWGGFYSWLLGGIDPRIRALFPSFGCGFYDLDLRYVWRGGFHALGAQKTEEWLRVFDPGRRAHLITARVYFETATNDKFFSMPSAMKTFDAVRSPKHLLLAANEDHFTRPYNNQGFRSLQNLIQRGQGPTTPWTPISFGRVEWTDGTAQVRVEAAADDVDITVYYSAGTYTRSFARFWRAVPAPREESGIFCAEMPVVDPNREIWFYAHAERRGANFATSSAIRRVVPRERGVLRATANYDPIYTIEPLPVYRLPVGDRVTPRASTFETNGATALRFQFEPPSGDDAKAVLYHLEGDLVQQHGYNAVDVVLRVPGNQELDQLFLLLVTDYHAYEEQTYGVPLSKLDTDFASFRRLRVPFATFEHLVTRVNYYKPPPAAPLDVGRLCGVGIYHARTGRPTEVHLLQSGVTNILTSHT